MKIRTPKIIRLLMFGAAVPFLMVLLTCEIDSPYLEIVEERIEEIEEENNATAEKPEVVITTPVNPAAEVPIPVTITFSTAMTGFDLTDIGIVNAELESFSTSDNIVYRINITFPSADPTIVTVSVGEDVAVDSSGTGNKPAASLEIGYDTSVLSVSLTSDAGTLTNVSPIPLTVTFNGPVEGFETADFNCTNCTVSNLTSGEGNSWTVDVVPSGEGTIQVILPAGAVQSTITGRGNTEAVFGTVYDSLPPSPPVVNGQTPTPDLTPEWSWTGGGGGNGTFRYKFNDSDMSSGYIETTDLAWTPESDLAEEIHYLYVIERDDAGNWSDPGCLAIEINTAIPSAPLVSGPDFTQDRTPEWTWVSGGSEHGAGIFRYRYDVDLVEGTWSDDTSDGSFNAYTADDDAEISIVFNVQEKSSANLWSASGTYTTVVDNVPPEPPEISPGAGVYGTNQDFTLLEVEDGADAEYSINSGGWSVYSSAVSLTAEEGQTETYSIEARQIDRAGNVSSTAGPVNVTIDKEGAVPPTISITAGIYGENKTFTLSDIEPTAQSAEYSLNGGTSWVVYESNSVTLDADPDTTETYNITARQTDSLGEVSAEAGVVTVVIDKEAPDDPAISGVETKSYDSNQSFTISGIETGGSAEYSLDDGSSWNDYSGSAVDLTANSGQEKTYTIIVRQSDSVGNLSEESEAVTVIIDRDPPSMPVINGIEDGGGYNDDQTFTLDNLEAGTTREYTIDGGVNWLTYPGTSVTISVSDDNEDVFDVKARQTDSAGNATESLLKTITIDKIDPATPGISDITDNEEYGEDQSFTLSGVESGAAAEYRLNGIWNDYSSAVSLTAGSGNSMDYDIQVRQTDSVGNVSSVSSEITVTIDKKPPSVTYFRIESGSSNTDDPVVSLSSSVSDVAEMCFKNDGDSSYSAWDTYSTYRFDYWRLTDGAGTRTVWAKYRDSLGNESDPVSDDIDSNPSWNNLDGEGLDGWLMSDTGYSGTPIPEDEGLVITTSDGNYCKFLVNSRDANPYILDVKYVTYEGSDPSDVVESVSSQEWNTGFATLYVDFDDTTPNPSTTEMSGSDISIYYSGGNETIQTRHGSEIDRWTP